MQPRNFLHEAPFIRIVICLATGIFLSDLFPSFLSDYRGLGMLTALLISLLLFAKSNTPLLNSAFFWVQSAFLLLSGYLYSGYYLNNKLHNTTLTGDGYYAYLTEVPQEKTNSYKAFIRLSAIKNGKEIKTVDEKMLTYFKKDSTINQLVPGSPIFFRTHPVSITNRGNPYEFDYKKYLKRQYICRMAFLKPGEWYSLKKRHTSLKIKALTLRKRVLDLYRKYGINDRNHAILSALTVGYKQELDPETKRSFSAAGAMHVLAVSGLHVGVIYKLLQLLLSRFLYTRKTKRLKLLLILSSLWTYAFIAGMSPSISRATVMFSILLIGQHLKRTTNIYNSLAIAAFILLLLDPMNLFQAGFQLSFLAVTSIVFFQPRLQKLHTPKNSIVNYIWQLFTVGLAAQILTFPLSLYYFQQFPSYFFLSNFIVIPAAGILLFLSVLFLAVTPLPYVAPVIAKILNTILSYLYQSIRFIEHLPGSTLQNITPGTGEMLLLFLLIIVCSSLFIYQRPKALIPLLILTIALTAIPSGRQVMQQSNAQFIIPNDTKNTTLLFSYGKTYSLYAIDDKPVDEKTFHYTFNPIITNLRLTIKNDTSLYYQKNQFIRFAGKTIFIPDKYIRLPDHSLPFNIDYLLLHNNPEVSIKKLIEIVSPKTVICPATNRYSPHKKWEKTCKTGNICYHNIKKEGAFINLWKP